MIFHNKANTKLNYPEGGIDKGSFASGTCTISVLEGGWQKVTATGDFTLAFSDIPSASSANSAWHVTIEAVNWDAHTVTLPAALDTPGGSGISLTASGTDLLEFAGNEGTTLFHGATAFEDTK